MSGHLLSGAVGLPRENRGQLAGNPGIGFRGVDLAGGAAGGIGLVLADDLAGDRGGIAAAEQEVAEHVGQGAAFGPGEEAVRPDAGGLVQAPQIPGTPPP